MKRTIHISMLAAALLAASSLAVAQPKVKTGLENLAEHNFEMLQGRRVGLVTNPTGVDNDLVSTADILYNAPNVELVALFGPEHGIRGDVPAGGYVVQTTDKATGLPIYSLYGATRKPSKDMLKGLDAIVYDIQDNGCRSYTFISTLGLMMQACAEQDIELFVLDRPNPLGGLKVEGSVVEDGYFSFVGMYKIPYVYGLTVGELAIMLNEEGMARGQKGTDAPRKCRLTVIPMEGWSREMTYSETGLPWVLPSPHIPQPESACCYPASGVVGELSGYVSIGVGYTLPFQLFASQWITDAAELCRRLNTLELPGVRFRTIYLTPYYGGYSGKAIQGVQFHFTDYAAAELTTIQFYVMQELYKMYPDHKPLAGEAKNFAMFDKVLGTSHIREAFGKRYLVADIDQFWHKDVAAFRALSKKYYLY